jgi:hypothetical protein
VRRSEPYGPALRTYRRWHRDECSPTPVPVRKVNGCTALAHRAASGRTERCTWPACLADADRGGDRRVLAGRQGRSALARAGAGWVRCACATRLGLPPSGAPPPRRHRAAGADRRDAPRQPAGQWGAGRRGPGDLRRRRRLLPRPGAHQQPGSAAEIRAARRHGSPHRTRIRLPRRHACASSLYACCSATSAPPLRPVAPHGAAPGQRSLFDLPAADAD